MPKCQTLSLSNICILNVNDFVGKVRNLVGKVRNLVGKVRNLVGKVRNLVGKVRNLRNVKAGLRHLSIRLRDESEYWRDAAPTAPCCLSIRKFPIRVSIVSMAPRRFWKTLKGLEGLLGKKNLGKCLEKKNSLARLGEALRGLGGREKT